MFKKTDSLQTLKLDSCKLNDTSIKQLEDGLLLIPTVALKLEYSNWKVSSWLNALLTVRSQNLCELNLGYLCTLNEENVRQLSELVTTCKQLRVLKVELSDNSESFFHALSDNQSLRELSIIQTTGKMATLLFQTLLSTSITTLDLSKSYNSKRLRNEGSLAFKEYIHRSKVLTVLRADDCGLTEEAFKGITFTKHSPLRTLILNDNYIKKGWTELFNSLCSSCITTLDVRNNTLDGEECCTALKCLLINNKILTVLKIGHQYMTNNDVVCCIADALSQNCSLIELTINTHSLSILGWTKLFESLHENTTLNTLNCSEGNYSQALDPIIAKSVCEMLIHNQGLQNLTITDKLIKGRLKEFAMAYIQRKPVLNLTVGKLEDDLVEEIEGLETDTDKEYTIESRYYPPL